MAKIFNYEERKANAIERNETRHAQELAERQRRVDSMKGLSEMTQQMLVAQDVRYGRKFGRMMSSEQFDQMVKQVRAVKP